ncbi:MAG: hypothetical protein EOO74_02250 [Myxococcales bacterium]|nr:MAG: hypothetical protein EOO74_02250 [Myxococcales bacterium]
MTTFSRFSALSAVAAAAAALLSPSVAEAAGGDFDTQPNLIITAERLFGYSYSSTNLPGDSKSTDSNFSLLIPSGGAGSVYGGPSVGVHYPIIPQLTLGAQLGLLYTSGTNKVGDVSKDKDSTFGFLLAPRVGYILGINPGAYIWLRGGLSYFRSSTGGEDDKDTVYSGLAVSIDPMVVITPVNHFGITIGPTVDLPLTGSSKTGDTSVDVTTTQIGLQFGLLGYL